MPAVVLARPGRQHRGQRGRAAGQVHDDAAGEIQHAHLLEPAAVAPDPVAHGIINQDGPGQGKDQKRPEAQAFGHGPGNQRRRDGREHALEHGEGQMGHGCGVVRVGRRADAGKPRPAQGADQSLDVRAEGQGIAEVDPFERDQGNQDEALHDGAEHVFLAHHAAVEKGQSRNHEQHQRRTDEDKGRIAALQHIAPLKKVWWASNMGYAVGQITELSIDVLSGGFSRTLLSVMHGQGPRYGRPHARFTRSDACVAKKGHCRRPGTTSATAHVTGPSALQAKTGLTFQI